MKQGAFNARWTTPDEVARTFVPTPHFQTLTHSTHTLLLGPRGCGKTTLLKMLTEKALRVWRTERAPAEKKPRFDYPQFEALYFASDIRWTYEVLEIERHYHIGRDETERIQRIMVSCAVLHEIVSKAKQKTYYNDELQADIAESIIEFWGIPNTVPHYRDIQRTLRKIVFDLRGALNYKNKSRIDEIIDACPPGFYGHALDVPIGTCNILSESIHNYPVGHRWALCYDELEISPSWLQKEVLESLRSVEQEFLLKLTWSPMLPVGFRSAPERSEDFTAIRLWYSHVQDSRNFCERMSKQYLENRFERNAPSPRVFLGTSMFAREEDPKETDDVYNRHSSIYKEFKSLASVDSTFRKALAVHQVNPDDPYSDKAEIRNTLFRKIKPTVLLRNAFWSGERLRSRKFVILFAGTELVYSMSEGNPRRLLGLMTGMYDRWLEKQTTHNTGEPFVLNKIQARVLNSAARRFVAYIASAVHDQEFEPAEDQSLYSFVSAIGEHFKTQILGPQFQIDPTGSFLVEEDVDAHRRKLIIKGLTIGALVYIGRSEEDIPTRVEGARFRLTFMLSPIYRLPVRNNRVVTLSTILEGANQDQLTLFDRGREVQS